MDGVPFGAARSPKASKGEVIPAESTRFGGHGDVAECGTTRQGDALSASAPGERRGLRHCRGPGPVPRGRRVHRRDSRLGLAHGSGCGKGLAKQLGCAAVLPLHPVPGRQCYPRRHARWPKGRRVANLDELMEETMTASRQWKTLLYSALFGSVLVVVIVAGRSGLQRRGDDSMNNARFMVDHVRMESEKPFEEVSKAFERLLGTFNPNVRKTA